MLNFLLPALFGYGISQATNSGSSKPEAPERMDYDEALNQAKDVLTPQYEKSQDKVMSGIQNNLVSRGFYGQAPGDAIQANTMADMESDFQGQLANYATNLQNNQYAQDYQSYQTDLSQYNQPDPFWQTIGSAAGSFMGGPGGSAVFNWLTS